MKNYVFDLIRYHLYLVASLINYKLLLIIYNYLQLFTITNNFSIYVFIKYHNN